MNTLLTVTPPVDGASLPWVITPPTAADTGIETLVAYGVGRDLAAAYTAVLHVALWVPVTAVGAWFFWREQLAWSDFGAAKAEASTADDGRQTAHER